VLVAVAVVVVLSVSGSSDEEPSKPAAGPPPTTPSTATAPAPAAPPGLAIGLAEQNPYLIGTDVPEQFAPWRDRTVALRPKVFRLLVDWSKVQPAADAPPDWAIVADGCLRGRPPCAPYGGIRDLLRTLKERQQSDGGWRIIASVYGAPAWAKEPAPGCPDGGTIRRDAYEALLRSLHRLAGEEGVEIPYLAPWNEPNHPTFLAPQRSVCDRDSPSLSPGAYADLVRAAGAAMPSARLVLGELAGYDKPRSDATGAAEFAAALPDDVVCASPIWGQHAYVGRGATRLAADREAGGHAALLADVGAALDAHGCERRHRIWITETGATPSEDACSGMDAALRAWEADDRVDVAVQYTFRQDTEFPVGLADARLTRMQPAYDAWLAWGGTRDPSGAPPADPCGA
jgi:hypothetical protein